MCIDCLQRKKEDPWNAILGGFCTGGALAVRGGARAMRNNAIGCAVLLAVIEGVGIAFSRMMAENTRLEVSSSFGTICPSLLFCDTPPECLFK